MIINLIKSEKLFLTISFTLLLFGCDSRIPTKSDSSATASSNYTLEIAAKPIAGAVFFPEGSMMKFSFGISGVSI